MELFTGIRTCLQAARIVARVFKRQTPERPGFGGAAGVTRTLDLLITNQLLYQLSYSSVPAFPGTWTAVESVEL
jgi:hypothetical protein